MFDVKTLPALFRDFSPYLDKCHFTDCRHLKEPDCAVRLAVCAGEICASRYESYVRLYEISAKYADWEK
jgi:ribosome biogenesis GTPase